MPDLIVAHGQQQGQIRLKIELIGSNNRHARYSFLREIIVENSRCGLVQGIQDANEDTGVPSGSVKKHGGKGFASGDVSNRTNSVRQRIKQSVRNEQWAAYQAS